MPETINSPNEQITREIQPSNLSSKASTPHPISSRSSANRSLSSSFAESTKLSENPVEGNIRLNQSPRDTPHRKYFDSGDYELAKAGILSAASVGSIHASPDKLQASRSSSSYQLQTYIISDSTSATISKSNSNSAHNIQQASNLQHSPIKISFSAASLENVSAASSRLNFPTYESIDEDVNMN